MARELVNKIQNMRKCAGLEVVDRIAVGVQSTPKVELAMQHFGNYISKETLSLELTSELPGDAVLVSQWDLNGEPATIGISRRGR